MDEERFRLVHEPSRLRILAYLASGTDGKASFQEIRSSLSLTAGNLSIQLKKLEESGAIRSEKSFVSSRPLTRVSITAEGRAMLSEYIKEIESILSKVR